MPFHGYVIIGLIRLARMQELPITVERILTGFPNVRRANFSAHATFEPFIAELAAAGLPE
jgi:hypothetical protein